MKSKQKKNLKKPKDVVQKREVHQIKFSVLPVELERMLEESKVFSSFSNYIRHQLGLHQLTTGRKKLITQPAFLIDEDF